MKIYAVSKMFPTKLGRDGKPVVVEVNSMTSSKVSRVELPILGSNIVNGTFASSSGWTVGANWSIGSGKATYTSGASNVLRAANNDLKTRNLQR